MQETSSKPGWSQQTREWTFLRIWLWDIEREKVASHYANGGTIVRLETQRLPWRPCSAVWLCEWFLKASSWAFLSPFHVGHLISATNPFLLKPVRVDSVLWNQPPADGNVTPALKASQPLGEPGKKTNPWGRCYHPGIQTALGRYRSEPPSQKEPTKGSRWPWKLYGRLAEHKEWSRPRPKKWQGIEHEQWGWRGNAESGRRPNEQENRAEEGERLGSLFECLNWGCKSSFWQSCYSCFTGSIWGWGYHWEMVWVCPPTISCVGSLVPSMWEVVESSRDVA